jgi:hypothetical protein
MVMATATLATAPAVTAVLAGAGVAATAFAATGAPRFLASSCQVDETLADLIDFLSAPPAGFLSSFFAGLAALAAVAGLCSVPSALSA